MQLKIVAYYFSPRQQSHLRTGKGNESYNILNMSDKGYPLEQDGPPQQQSPSPQQGYPQNLPPQAGYPVQQAYLPPQQGYLPQQGYQPQTGYPPQQVPVAPMVIRDCQTPANDYLTFAILVTIFCCWPLGIVAIIKALEVRSLNERGDYTSAQQASEIAKKWCIGTLTCGIVIITISCVFYAVMNAAYFFSYIYGY